MWCQKGDVIQSRSTGRYFLVLTEDVSFGKGEITYTLTLQPMLPFRNTGNHPITVRLGIDQIKCFHVGHGFKDPVTMKTGTDKEPWEMYGYQLQDFKVHSLDDVYCK